MVVKSAAAQKEHFLSCAVSSHFLVLFVEFFLGKLPKTGFFAQCHESDIFARFVVFRLGKFRYDDTKERLAAACPALPDAEKQQGGIHLHFIDAGGSFTHPRAVLENRPGVPTGACRAGREAMGAFRFAPLTLAPGAAARYILLLGMEERDGAIDRLFVRYDTAAKVDAALASALRGGFPVQHKR